jgi:hypothetical protein
MHDIVTCEIELKWGFPWFWFQPPKLKPAEQRGHPSTSGLSLWVPSSVRPGSGEAERWYIGTVIFWDIMDDMPKEGLFIKKNPSFFLRHKSSFFLWKPFFTPPSLMFAAAFFPCCGTAMNQWPFEVPELEVPFSICKVLQQGFFVFFDMHPINISIYARLYNPSIFKRSLIDDRSLT